MQEKLTFRLPWQLIKFSNLDLIHMVVRGLLKEHFVKIPSQIEIKAYFHFTHYKSMETATKLAYKLAVDPDIKDLQKTVDCHIRSNWSD